MNSNINNALKLKTKNTAIQRFKKVVLEGKNEPHQREETQFHKQTQIQMYIYLKQTNS